MLLQGGVGPLPLPYAATDVALPFREPLAEAKPDTGEQRQSRQSEATKNDKRLPNGRKSLKLRGLCIEMYRQQRLRNGWDKPKPTSLPRMVRKQYKGVLMITPIGRDTSH